MHSDWLTAKLLFPGKVQILVKYGEGTYNVFYFGLAVNVRKSVCVFHADK